MQLKSDVWAVALHGITRQEVEEGWLVAGTLVRNVSSQNAAKTHFQASTDGGDSWYDHYSFQKLETVE